MVSATLAALAPPELLSAGIMVSVSSSTMACCAGVKKCAADPAWCSSRAAGGVAGLTSACGSAAATVEAGKSEAPIIVAEVFSHCRRSCLRSMGFSEDIIGSLQVAFLEFVRQIVAGAPAERHDGPGGVLTTGVDERAAVHHKQIFHVVGLLELVQHRSLGVVSHARSAQLMNGPAFGESPVPDLDDFKTRRLEHLFRSFLHVLAHLVLVVAELVVKAQRRHAPLVLYCGVEVHIVLVTRQHFAEAAHADVGALVFTHLLLKSGAKAGHLCATRKHGRAAAAFESVAANEVRLFLLQVAEPGEIKAARPAVIERGRLANQILRAPENSRAHDVFAEVVTHMA